MLVMQVYLQISAVILRASTKTVRAVIILMALSDGHTITVQAVIILMVLSDGHSKL